MWVLKLEDAISCGGCNHAIFDGELCFASVPAQLPKGERRKDYPHFHLDCPGCVSDISCYQAYASIHTSFASRGRRECVYCRHSIQPGDNAVRDDRYFLEYGGGNQQKAGSAFHAFMNNRVDPTAKFQNLSASSRMKFKTAGLGGKRGIRTNAQAEQFFNSSIPAPVRNLGEGAARNFTKGRHASHIESVASAPAKAKSAGNVMWESAKSNLRRGGDNMTRPELIGAKIKNGAHATKIVSKGVVTSAGRAGAISAALELPISAAENGIHVARGGKNFKEAARDVAADTAKAGVAGGVVAGGITFAAALGAGAAIAAAAPVATAVGTGVFGASTILRIRRAMKDARIGHEDLYFHAGCAECDTVHTCHELFTAHVALYALDDLLKDA